MKRDFFIFPRQINAKDTLDALADPGGGAPGARPP